MWDERFEKILRGRLPFLSADEPLTEGLDLRDFGLDSMAMVDVLAALESEYDTAFVGDAMSTATFATPETLWETLQRMIARSA